MPSTSGGRRPARPTDRVLLEVRRTGWIWLQVAGAVMLGLRGSAGAHAVPVLGYEARLSLLLALVGASCTALGAVGAGWRTRTTAELHGELSATTARLRRDRARLRRDRAGMDSEKSLLEGRLADAEGALLEIAEQVLATCEQRLGLAGTGRVAGGQPARRVRGRRRQERISLFLAGEDHFSLLARHALNPVWRTPGRGRYSLLEGLLGQAWEQGYAHAEGLPDPAVDRPGWVEAQHALGLPPSAAQHLRMPSRSYLLVRIDEPDGRRPLGLLAVESEQPTDLTGAVLSERVPDWPGPLLSLLLVKLAAITPDADPCYARREGF